MGNRILSCARGFLGTIISRYSSYDGYWIYGYVINKANMLEIDLLDEFSKYPGRDPINYFIRLAIIKFNNQASKNRIKVDDLQMAKLLMRNTNIEAWGIVNGKQAKGNNVHIEILINKKNGVQISENKIIFVAPHNPLSELRNVKRFPVWSLFPTWTGL